MKEEEVVRRIVEVDEQTREKKLGENGEKGEGHCHLWFIDDGADGADEVAVASTQDGDHAEQEKEHEVRGEGVLKAHAPVDHCGQKQCGRQVKGKVG